MKESYAVIMRLKSGESPPNNAVTDFVRNSSTVIIIGGEGDFLSVSIDSQIHD